MSDGFDSMTKSSDDEFHEWAAQDGFIIEDIDIYESCDSAWAEGKRSAKAEMAALQDRVSDLMEVLAVAQNDLRMRGEKDSNGIVVEGFRLGAYATGNYSSRCAACSEMFVGDKRALVCLPCAIKGVEALQSDNKALQSQLSEVVAERDALKERAAELESTHKDWCINFHFWWMGVGGTNTYQGYADWLKLGCPIAAGPPTTPESDNG